MDLAHSAARAPELRYTDKFTEGVGEESEAEREAATAAAKAAAC